MRYLVTLAAAACLIGCGPCFAQVAPTPGMGATSPLGTMDFNAASQPSGIPLGATELNTGGLSPTAGTNPCSGSTTSATGLAGSMSTFDGGGAMPGSTSATSTTCSATASGSAIGSTSMITGSTPGSMSSGTIPLGSTELGTPGESPTTLLPVPGVSVSPCSSLSPPTGTLGTLNSPGATGTSGAAGTSVGATGPIALGGMTSLTGC